MDTRLELACAALLVRPKGEMMRPKILMMALLLLATGTGLSVACTTSSAPEPAPAEPQATAPEPPAVPARPVRPEQVPMPQPLRIVGEASVGTAIESELDGEGIEVASDFAGREAGIRSFCAGDADGLALSSDLDDAERKTCKELGGGWSALSDEAGRIMYVRYAIAKDLMDRSGAF